MRQPVHCWFSARAIPVPRDADRRSKRVSHSDAIKRAERFAFGVVQLASSVLNSCLADGDAGLGFSQELGEAL